MATGATNNTVELIEQTTVARYTTRIVALSWLNCGSNGAISRKPVSNWTPVCVTRNSCSKLVQLRSSRCVSDSDRTA